MIPQYHPSEERLCDHTTGAQAEGPASVITAHLGACQPCRARVRVLEAVGGALLLDLDPAPMHADALAVALARIERPVDKAPVHRSQSPPLPDWIDDKLPEVRDAWRRRRWAAPGVWVAPVRRERDGARSYLLRVGPSMSVPKHSHRGSEMVCVLKGAYVDGGSTHRVGDFVENDATVVHVPTVTPDGECVCLVYADAALAPRGWIGRLFQPFVGI